MKYTWEVTEDRFQSETQTSANHRVSKQVELGRQTTVSFQRISSPPYLQIVS